MTRYEKRGHLGMMVAYVMAMSNLHSMNAAVSVLAPQTQSGYTDTTYYKLHITKKRSQMVPFLWLVTHILSSRNLQFTRTHTHTHTCVLIPLDRGRVLSWSSSALLSGSRWYSIASISRANARGFPLIRLSLVT